MNKVIVRIIGGVGNQLFSYAAARRLAVANGAELVVDNVSGFTRDIEYRRRSQLDQFAIPCRKATRVELLEPFSRLRRHLKCRLNRLKPFDRRNYIQQEGVDFDDRLLRVRVSGTVYLEGYWQSEDYFKDIEDIIRSDLQIQPPCDTRNLEMATHMRTCVSVAVHVRFFDATSSNGINNTPDDYYSRAIAEMERLVPGAHYFIFSDRPDAARARIPLSDQRISCIDHNLGDAGACADLWLMTQCKHYIIANSTFSWWGAWLANGRDKMVIAPGFEMREGVAWWGFRGLIPKGWMRC